MTTYRKEPFGSRSGDRQCFTCKEWFAPYSMRGGDSPPNMKELIVPVPSAYECITCRSKAAA